MLEQQLKPPLSHVVPGEGVGRRVVFAELCRVVLATLFLFLYRKGPVETKSEPQESEAKPAPTEVKTVPNDATQTKENESKA